jgi:acyl-CoA thioester hydrolase
MARIKLRERPLYEFTYTFTVQARDLSSRRHLGADAIVQMLHEAVANLFQTLGVQELDLGDGKTGVITEETVIDFRREAFLLDILTIETHVDEVDSSGLRMYHRMIRSGEIAALAESRLVGFDYGRHTVVPIPETFNSALLRHRQQLQTAVRT